MTRIDTQFRTCQTHSTDTMTELVCLHSLLAVSAVPSVDGNQQIYKPKQKQQNELNVNRVPYSPRQGKMATGQY